MHRSSPSNIATGQSRARIIHDQVKTAAAAFALDFTGAIIARRHRRTQCHLPQVAHIEVRLTKVTRNSFTHRRALAKMRKLLPGSTEMVYDNYNRLVIGFGPTEKPSLAIFSILLMPGHVTLCFLQGVHVPDPNRRLKGGGNLVRHGRLVPPAVLDDPEILDLINTALYRAKVPINPKAPRRLIIKSSSAKQRPRRPAQS